MRHPPASIAIAMTLLVGTLLAGCASGTSAITPPSIVPTPIAPSPATTPTAAPSDAMLPTAMVGTWVGSEYDANLGETWETTYRIAACRQHVEPWWKPKDDQQCGDWSGAATVEGQPATCSATLSWLEMDGDTLVFQASHAERSAKYRTIPHPYLEIDGTWYCWDTFRVRMTPEASGSVAVETIGAGALAGAFTATRGSVARIEP